MRAEQANWVEGSAELAMSTVLEIRQPIVGARQPCVEDGVATGVVVEVDVTTTVRLDVAELVPSVAVTT